MSANLEQLTETLSSLTVLELAELSKSWKKNGCFSCIFCCSCRPASGGGGAEEVKDKFEVVLAASGDNKINVIKEVRAITGLGLKEAKDLVEGAQNCEIGCFKEGLKSLRRNLKQLALKLS